MDSHLFRDRRTTVLWLRWLLLIALSYLLLLSSGRLMPSAQALTVIPLGIVSNIVLAFVPATLFTRGWFNFGMVLFDTLLVSVALVTTGVGSGYLPTFYFLIMLMTTLGRGSASVITNGLMIVGIYALFLAQAHGMRVFYESSLFIGVPFLLIAAIFYAVLVHQEYERHSKEQRKAENALVRTEAGFRSLIENSPDSIFVHSGTRLIYVNPATARYLEYDRPSELIGKEFLELVHADDRQVVQQLLEGSSTETATGDARLLRRHGGTADAELSALALTFEGQPVLMLVARDLTESKRMQAQLLLSDRMASMGMLSAGIGHEINNPLSYVIANLDYATRAVLRLQQSIMSPSLIHEAKPLSQSATSPADPGQEFLALCDALKEAQQGAERMRTIVRNLKAFSRAEDEPSSTIDVRRTMEPSIGMAWNEIRHRARLVKDYGNTPLVRGTEAELGQVFLNLLINATQAIPEGNVEGNEIRIVTYTSERGTAVIEVRDTGPGIADAELNRIFDPFYTTKPVGVGTGLGLAICYSSIQKLGGTISVDSRVGKGTTFRVELPGADAAAVEAERGEQPEIVSNRRGRILIIDDENFVCESVKRTLDEDHDVIAVRRAQTALTHLSEGKSFDVILCDLMMPEMTGMDFHAELQRIDPVHAERTIFLTGGAFTPKAREFLKRTTNERIEKPFDPQNLRAVIRKRTR